MIIFSAYSFLALAQASSIYKIALKGNGQEVTIFNRSNKEEGCKQLPLTFQLVSELDAPAPYDRSTRSHTIEFMHLQQFFAFTISTRDGYAGLIQYDVEQQPTAIRLSFLPQAGSAKPELWYPAKNAILYWNCSGVGNRSMILEASGHFTLAAYSQSDSLLFQYQFNYTETNIKVSTNSNTGVQMTVEKKQTHNNAKFGDYVIVRRFEIPTNAKTYKVQVDPLGLREQSNLNSPGFTEVEFGDTITALRLGKESPWFRVVKANGEPIEAYTTATSLYTVARVVGGKASKAAVEPQNSAGVSGRTKPKKPESSTVIKKN